ncbi:MAG: FkbM family methyltransferase [Thermoguttaceae bacterium]
MASAPLQTELEELLNEAPATAVEREAQTFDEMTAPLGRNFVLFGAGGLGRKILRVLRSQKIEPLAFSDNAAALWGKDIDGLKVLSPVDAAARFGRSATFVVCVFSSGRAFLPIRKQLTEHSCANVVSFLPLFWKYPDECLPHLLVDLPHRMLSQRDDVWNAFILLADDSSRREYVAQVRWRLRSDFEALPPPTDGDQYFPEDLFALTPDELFVDCGAFDGDTIQALVKRRTDFKKVVAIEPDPMNFDRLQRYLSSLPKAIRDRISLHRLGVGAENCVAHFEAVGTSGSSFSKQGGIEVECNALDHILDGCAPTFVKMDIEGAELDALRGASGLLHQSSAVWAVCVYHKPGDLWHVPLAISSYMHNNDCRFFLRKYVPEMWETVCYAIPRERLVS